MAITKNLLPKSDGAAPKVELNSWGKMEHPEQFIGSISTSGSDMSDAAKYNLLVSSVPSPWARVHLTRHAVFKSKDNSNSIMSQYYAFLRSEWRGLIAAYVLYPNCFELTNPIELKHSTREGFDGRFDIRTTYADMLFENSPYWKYAPGDNEYPQIQLLYFNGQLIGATSPFTMFFAGMNYIVQPDEQHIYWVRDGKFQDPSSKEYEKYYKEGGACFQKDHLDNLCKLYSFLLGVQTNKKLYIDKLKDIVKSSNLNNSCDEIDTDFGQALTTWVNDIKTAIGNLAEVSDNIPVHHKRPEGPLKILLTIDTTYYWYDKTFHTKKRNEEKINVNGEIYNIGSLFIDGNHLAAWDAYEDENGNNFDSSPVHFLKEKNGTLFLSMPFSKKALDEVFNEDILSIIEGSNPNVEISAVSKNADTVDVTLFARIDGQGELVNIYNRTFNIERPTYQNRKVFAWPNFTSPQWNKYYYYSEFPMNGIGEIQMVPIFDDKEDIESDLYLKNTGNSDFSHLVKFPDNGTKHAYEIIRTSKSLNRIKLRKNIGNQKCDLGWLIIRREKDATDSKRHMRVIPSGGTIRPVTIGFDFGSTNSCAYFSTNTTGPTPVPFSNRRLAIIGFDNKQGEPAEKNELLFISNEEPINKNGQVKSWLHEHDEAYIPGGNLNEEIVGGVPVNETNIKVTSMDEVMIITNAGVLHYNMKWLIEEKDNQRKAAFFKMLWIQICADLFAGPSSSYPTKLNWSYPSAMGKREIAQLKSIFSGAQKVSPFTSSEYALSKDAAYTEAEAVCTYFLGKGNNGHLNDRNLFVGIDIGGSTSDILILGKYRDFSNNNNSLSGIPKLPPIPGNQPILPALPNVSYYYVENGQQRGPISAQQMFEMKQEDKFAKDTLVFKFGMINWQKAGEIAELAPVFAEAVVPPVPILPPVPEIPAPPAFAELPKVSYHVYLNNIPSPQPLDASQLMRMKSSGELTESTMVWNPSLAGPMPAGQVTEMEFLFTSSQPAMPKFVAETPEESYGRSVDRLYSQCSVRIAANAFFYAIIGSKSFRDCIRNFEASKETHIRVIGIEGIDNDPSQAPYYLNNIFDQLKGDKEFVSFYKYIQVHEPFVFTLPAYITGALMTYTGMLIRSTILTNKMKDIREVRFGYFGKGGRLFEWLYFTYGVEEVNAYLNACFNVGLKQEIINKELGTTGRIRFCCNNVEDKDFAKKDSTENKSEVAIGLVRPMDIAGIKSKNISNSYDDNTPEEDPTCDPSQQDIVGEVGIRRNGKLLRDIDLVGNDFYINEGNIEYPYDKMENFNAFMNKFVKFVSAETSIFPKSERLVSQLSKACNAGQYIKNDNIYTQYKEDTSKDSYRMPVFIATSLYYLEHCLLPEVFGANKK